MTVCQFVRLEPAPGTPVMPGENVTIVTGALPCAPESTPDDGSTQ
jgi:hypothetical protein